MKQADASWPAGPGDMAARIRALNWTMTPLGAFENWPDSLHHTVQLLLDHPVPMLLGWGPDLIVIYNDAYSSLLGNKSEALGRPFLEVWAEAHDVLAPQIAETLAGKTSRFRAASFLLDRGKGTEEAFFDYALSPLRDAIGRIAGILNTGLEVTDRVLAERHLNQVQAALHESEERHRLLVESWAQAVWETNPDGVVITDSPSWRLYTGQTLEEWLGYGWLDAIHPEDRAYAERQWREAVAAHGLVDAEFRLRAPSGGWRWTNVRAAPMLDTAGQIENWVGMNIDIEERKRSEAEVLRLQDQIAQAQIRQGEERLRQFGEASQDVLWIRDADSLQWQYLTAAFETIYGLSRDEALSGDNYRSWLQLVIEEDREHAHRNIQRVLEGEQVVFEYRIKRPVDGGIRWLRNTDFPITNETGEVTLIGGIGHDITETKMRQEQLEASEERLRIAAQVAKLGLWDWDMRSGAIHWSDEHFRMEGYAVDEVVPSYQTWAARLHPEDRAGTEKALRDAQEQKNEYVHEFRTLHPDGTVRWLSARGNFFNNENDTPIRMVGAMIDVTERRILEDRQKVLVAELQHRTRNLMAVVLATVRRTGEASSNFTDFRQRLDDRFYALARVQGLLSRLNDTDRIAFDELVRAELSAMTSSMDRVALDGPSGVRLRSSTVQTLAMALHELATNATKYGALGQPRGNLAISWRLIMRDGQQQPRLHIEWRESGVQMPPVGSAAQGGGQGRELIEQALPYQLDAETSFELGPDGVRCTITIPVSQTDRTEISSG